MTQQLKIRKTKIVKLRLPNHVLEGLKTVANKRYVPYQTLVKIWLAEMVIADQRR